MPRGWCSRTRRTGAGWNSRRRCPTTCRTCSTRYRTTSKYGAAGLHTGRRRTDASPDSDGSWNTGGRGGSGLDPGHAGVATTAAAAAWTGPMSTPIVPSKVRTVFTGRVFTVQVESITLPKGHKLDAEIVRHPGSVVIVPITATGEIILARQYRHAIGRYTWELPA